MTHSWRVALLFMLSGSMPVHALPQDPRAVPVLAPWLAYLKSNYPLFQDSDRDLVWVGPKHLRIRSYPNGAPMIQLRRRIFGNYYYVSVEVELGVFGEEGSELRQVLKDQAVSWAFAPVSMVRIRPLDESWDEASEAIGESAASLYSSFEQIGTGEARSPTEGGDLVLWSGRVYFVTSRLGTQLMSRVLKGGLYEFPLIAQIEFSAASPISMTVAGGIGCLHRSFWGRSRKARTVACENYWSD